MLPRHNKTISTVLIVAILLPVNVILAQTTGTQTSSMTTTTPRDFFLTNLRQGNHSEDVRTLQKVLNSNEQTRLTNTGTGSPGQETDYFGSLTFVSVVKFQELHTTEILSPLQLTQGTGFVGPMTRKKLNEAAVSAGITIEGQGTVSGGASAGSSNPSSGGSSSSSSIVKPKIISISPASVLNGADITITGEGFTSIGNQVRTTFLTLDNISSSDGKTITFKFYADQINSLMGIDALKQDGTTPDEILSAINDMKLNHPESALPANRQLLFPVYMSVSNKNGASNTVKFDLDLDTTHYLATSTPPVSTNTNKSLVKRIADSISSFTFTNIAEAKSKGCNWSCWYNIAQKAAIAYWASQILGNITGGSVGQSDPAFGGNVIMAIPCICSWSTAFIVLPKAGSPGPYNATWPPLTLEMKENYAIFPGNHVLGSSLPEGECGIYVILACFYFDAKEINPLIGVGTSLTPF